MSGRVPSYQGRNECILLKLIFRYEGLKATQYFSKFTSQSDAVFRDDVFTLKLPHPKRENTTFVSYGCVECAWPLVPKDGTLHNQVLGKIKPHNPEDRKALGILLNKLSISSLAVKEISPKAGNGRKNLKRPNPFNSEGREERSSSGLRSEGNGYRVSLPIARKRPLPHNVAPKVAEAEAFLQDVSDSFRPHKMMKTEPVDVPLPPEPLPTRSVKSLRLWRRTPPSLSSHLSSHLSSTSKATNPPESPSSSSSLVSQKPPRPKVVSPPHGNHASPLLAKALPATTPMKMIMPTSLSDGPDRKEDMIRKLQSTPQSLPEVVQCQLSVPDAKTMDTPAPQMSFEVTTCTNSRPDTFDISRFHHLTRASCEIRRRINADSVRDASIISELKRLNAPYIPGPLKIADLAMEGRIRKLEEDLEAERMLRLEAEDVVNDIRRECKAPFIVPGLLDAFIKLSRLTTQANRFNGTVPKDNTSTIVP